MYNDVQQCTIGILVYASAASRFRSEREKNSNSTDLWKTDSRKHAADAKATQLASTAYYCLLALLNNFYLRYIIKPYDVYVYFPR